MDMTYHQIIIILTSVAVVGIAKEVKGHEEWWIKSINNIQWIQKAFQIGECEVPCGSVTKASMLHLFFISHATSGIPL